MKLPEKQNGIPQLIDAAVPPPTPRPHWGVSMIGDPCDRKLWLSYRWALPIKTSGRVLRLFRRGQMEEETVVSDLESIGCVVTARQRRVKFSPVVSGSIDGIITGVPGAEKTQHILEIKTHNDKSFQDLKKNGVQKSKPAHYVQMQGYMKGTRLDRALYVAVNKNDDEYYTERVNFDEKYADAYINRAMQITRENSLPAPLSTSPDWYLCKMCDYYEYCHGSEKAVEHCRTCENCFPTDDGIYCREYKKYVPVEYQLSEYQKRTCKVYQRHFDLK